ncbi:MAG: signal peptidase I [Acidimicrobiia bacterium]
MSYETPPPSPPEQIEIGLTNELAVDVEENKSPVKAMIEWLVVVGAALLVALIIRWQFFGAYVIPSGSMYPTLQYQGTRDRVLVNKLSYKLHDIHRGDVVVFSRPPAESDQTIKDLIKRVIGLPGDSVSAKNNVVYIGDQPLDEPYVNPACGGTRDFGPVVVPDGELFVMGDNRCNSEDSRVFGTISDDLVVGRAFVRVWPLDHLGWL